MGGDETNLNIMTSILSEFLSMTGLKTKQMQKKLQIEDNLNQIASKYAFVLKKITG